MHSFYSLTIQSAQFGLLFLLLYCSNWNPISFTKVVGNSVGLPAIWVLSAVIVSGSLFGILGMLLAIPTTSVIYELIRRWVNRKNGAPVSDNNVNKEKNKTIIIHSSVPPKNQGKPD